MIAWCAAGGFSHMKPKRGCAAQNIFWSEFTRQCLYALQPDSDSSRLAKHPAVQNPENFNRKAYSNVREVLDI